MSRTQASTYDRALTLLGFRARSVAELRRRLLQAGAAPTEVEAVIQRLVDQKLLNDEDFAVQFARSKLLGAGASRRRIVQELARKGVASDIARRALDSLQQDEEIDTTAAIARLAERKWQSLHRLDLPTRRRRLYAFLARRGFEPDEIRAVMSQLGATGDPA